MASIRLSVPVRASSGEIVEIKALIRHPMESGHRRGARGEVIERDIIKRFECSFLGNLVFSADFHPGIAANPLLTFYVRASASGELVFTWTDQHGSQWSEASTLTVA